MPKSRQRYAIAMDVETGGLPGGGKLAFVDIALTEIAFAVVDLYDLQIVDKASWLIKPNYKEGLIYSVQAQEVSGINIDMLKEKGVEVMQVFREIKAFLKKYTSGQMSRPVLVGHNIVKFDAAFIENMFIFFGDDLSNYVAGYEDTMLWAGYKFLESANYKLGTICQNMNIELTQAHRALTDTIATADLFIEFVSFLRASEKKEKEEGNNFRNKFKFDVKYDF